MMTPKGAAHRRLDGRLVIATHFDQGSNAEQITAQQVPFRRYSLT
jgi:hypothetical protein